ncbi:MAG: 30S ribosomal protein S5 [uncultured bacterium (gcode 4)]|uniref:Small ribosomal subunit protein uS5 n=1 Tax=uncultured bacterium (gcode 4) TaxID=1234023 RepID=K2G4B1_9BACT|nr:MAG: 30S ribosomal protein S5 [uncultured bacterium (gcode 4)]
MKRDDSKKWGFKEANKEFKEELLRIDRVTRVTAWGRQLRFRASVIIGDNNGTVGLGIGKAWEVVVAIEKAVRDAKKNLVKFKIVGGTIAHNVTWDFKAASIMIHPATAGTGIIAWGAVRKIISVSWIKDILAKRYGCTNPITNARATLKALQMLKIADARNVKATSVEAESAVEEVKAPVAATEAPAQEEVKEVKVEAPKEEAAPVAEKAPAKKEAPAKKAPAKKTK